MKITLTEDQIILKKAFRAQVLAEWLMPKHVYMYNVLQALQKQLGYTERALYDALSSIPSIRWVYKKTEIRFWLSMHYPTVSAIMYSTGDPFLGLKVWKTAKYVGSSSMIRSPADRRDMAKAKHLNKIIKIFNDYKPDTGNHVWSECK